MDAEKAQKQADKQISGMMTLGQMFQLITIDNNTASLQLRYTPGKVVLTDRKWAKKNLCLVPDVLFIKILTRLCSFRGE